MSLAKTSFSFAVVLLVCTVRMTYAAELDHAKLRLMVEKSIATEDSTLDLPTVRQVDGKLFVTLGGLRKGYVAAMTPLDFPIESQFMAEAVRRSTDTTIPQSRWRNVAELLDRAAGDHLLTIRNHTGDTKSLVATLTKSHSDLLQSLDSTLGGSDNNVTIQTPKAAGKYRVTVKTMPEKAAVFYVTVFKYQVLRDAGKLDEDAEWNEVFDNPNFLGGNFYFRARWEDGRERSTGKVEIDRRSNLTLTPEPR